MRLHTVQYPLSRYFLYVGAIGKCSPSSLLSPVPINPFCCLFCSLQLFFLLFSLIFLCFSFPFFLLFPSYFQFSYAPFKSPSLLTFLYFPLGSFFLPYLFFIVPIITSTLLLCLSSCAVVLASLTLFICF